MNYNLFLIGLFVVLLIVYLIIRTRENSLPVVSVDSFGPESSSRFQFNKKQKDKIIEQKIAHKNLAFYIYVFSLVVSLALGCYFAIKVLQHMGSKLWQDALSVSSGILSTVSTISFKKLHDKCEKDLNNLYR
jgi:hypothetical protein